MVPWDASPGNLDALLGFCVYLFLGLLSPLERAHAQKLPVTGTKEIFFQILNA